MAFYVDATFDDVSEVRSELQDVLYSLRRVYGHVEAYHSRDNDLTLAMVLLDQAFDATAAAYTDILGEEFPDKADVDRTILYGD